MFSISIGFGLLHCVPCLELSFISYLVHHTLFDDHAYLCHAKTFVEGINSFTDELCRLEVYLIISLDIDTLPQFLKLSLLKLLFVKVGFFGLARIVDIGFLQVEHTVECLDNPR